MIRDWLPAIVYIFLSLPATAQQLDIPDLRDNAPAPHWAPCENTQDQNNCARVLACVGNDGLWLDGQARGWNSGTMVARRNDGVMCSGTWEAGIGLLGTGMAWFQCDDVSKGQAVYYHQDELTGTAIARGMDSHGRHIRAWTGLNVLRFLGDGDVLAAKLPCTDAAIPIG